MQLQCSPRPGSGSCCKWRCLSPAFWVSLFWDGLIENLEEDKVIGKTRRPVGSSNVNCSHFSTPILQRRRCRHRIESQNHSTDKYISYEPAQEERVQVACLSRAGLEPAQMLTLQSHVMLRSRSSFNETTCSGTTLAARSAVPAAVSNASLATNKVLFN